MPKEDPSLEARREEVSQSSTDATPGNALETVVEPQMKSKEQRETDSQSWKHMGQADMQTTESCYSVSGTEADPWDNKESCYKVNEADPGDNEEPSKVWKDQSWDSSFYVSHKGWWKYKNDGGHGEETTDCHYPGRHYP